MRAKKSKILWFFRFGHASTTVKERFNQIFRPYPKQIFGIFCLILFFSSCHKDENSGVENSALKSLSNSFVVDLVDILPTEDGGCIVAANTWKNGNQDFWIIRYNAELIQMWERVLGGEDDEQLQKICRAKTGEILLGGISDGFDQDNTPDNVNKKEVLYFHCLDESGNSLWEKAYPHSNWEFSPDQYKQSVTDIIENSEGEFIICGAKAHTAPTSGGITVGLVGLLIKATKDGEFVDSYIQKIGSSPWGVWDAIFERENNYTVFWNIQQSAGFLEIEKQKAGDYLPYADNSANTQWPWAYEIIPPETKARVKINSAQKLAYLYFFEDKVYTYSYDWVRKSVIGSETKINLGNVVSAHAISNNHILITTSDGMVHEADANLNILHKFKIDRMVKISSKLTDGKYIFGIQKDNIVTLFKTDRDGTILR